MSSAARLPTPFDARWTVVERDAGTFEGTLALDDEALFRGHFPGQPILPGVYLVEAVARAVRAHLIADETRSRLRGISSCRFQRACLPGETIRARITLRGEGDLGQSAVASVFVGETKAALITLVFGAAPPRAESEAVRELGIYRTYGQDFIRRVLPHRYPMLLVDRAELVQGEGADKPELRVIKAISANEPCYAGPPGEPDSRLPWPAVLITESLGQSCAIHQALEAPPASDEPEPAGPGVLARLGGVTFMGEAFPGDVLVHRVELVTPMGRGAVYRGETTVRERAIMRADRIVVTR